MKSLESLSAITEALKKMTKDHEDFEAGDEIARQGILARLDSLEDPLVRAATVKKMLSIAEDALNSSATIPASKWKEELTKRMYELSKVL